MARSRVFHSDHPRYRWVALSNTTLGMLIATINSSILLISLPAIFTGIKLNPLEPSNVSYLLWIIMGYTLITAVLVVSFGRLGDMFGRVRIYNLGFAIFTVGAIALVVIPFSGSAAALWIIGWRLVQASAGRCSWPRRPRSLPTRSRRINAGWRSGSTKSPRSRGASLA